METKFNSQICTSREQSERLLKLGLKKETADVTIHHEYGITTIFGIDYSKYVDLHKEQGYTEDFFKNVFPAWSLHRLMELLASKWGECMVFLPDAYDEIISDIEIEIGRGSFNKEFLV